MTERWVVEHLNPVGNLGPGNVPGGPGLRLVRSQTLPFLAGPQLREDPATGYPKLADEGIHSFTYKGGDTR